MLNELEKGSYLEGDGAMLGWKQRKQLVQNLKKAVTQVGMLRRQGKQPQAELIEVLRQIDTACQLQLSAQRATHYHEIFHGLEEALQRDWQQMKLEERQEASVLLQDILGSVIVALQQEPGRRIIVFLPYKAAMWDSLESVWMAADADENCEAYVIPIPYYERKTDYTLGTMHYEGDMFPDYVPIIDYRSVSLKTMHPDAIYIHNPYDEGNLATSIAPDYYANQLNQYTDNLVYIPYFTTAGGMGDGQRWCYSYDRVDYIIVQAESLIEFYDKSVDRQKIIPLGSPKFDRVIRLCKNRPEIPEDWHPYLDGKKVYFYNTSLAGMLNEPWAFLKKMNYVFQTFREHPETCLLWRPHPLLESTYRSMRKDFLPYFLQLKQQFLDEHIGIYDDTPDIETAIAWSDVYIGDSGTSVTALFGVAGKPIFLFDNYINRLPAAEDEQRIFYPLWQQVGSSWLATEYNDLLWSPKADGHYAFYARLSDYVGGQYYGSVFVQDDQVIVCPLNGQDILILQDKKLVRRIPLRDLSAAPPRFADACRHGRYIFLIPVRYPAIVRYDIQTCKVDYVEGYSQLLAGELDGRWLSGGYCLWQDKLLLASPADGNILVVDVNTLATQQLLLDRDDQGGCLSLIPYGNEIWLLPRKGFKLRCWKPQTGELNVYEQVPEDYSCVHVPLRFDCDLLPWGTPLVTEDIVYLPPWWGNQFLKLDKKTGTFMPWEVPFKATCRSENCYFASDRCGDFQRQDSAGDKLFFYAPDRSLYKFYPETNQFNKQELVIVADSQKQLDKGFARQSEWMRYACQEDTRNTLAGFLAGQVYGNRFQEDEQMKAFSEIAAHIEGDAGIAIHRFIMEKIAEK
ncbi:hypothetical protein [Selenomonas ruminantium]|uniref:hypothetical protein n=1 Tax=Selenomonas ruminantium TaxID=971 RepID=UPI0012D34FA0|nr:hypothetical protein [Selenomonas ruminantium]